MQQQTENRMAALLETQRMIRQANKMLNMLESQELPPPYGNDPMSLQNGKQQLQTENGVMRQFTHHTLNVHPNLMDHWANIVKMNQLL